MAFLIEDVRKASPVAGQRYLFDANVWLAVLDPNFQTYYSQEYTDFFDAILNNKLNPRACIVLPLLLLSEVLNRLMNDIYYKEFCLRNPKADNQSKYYHYKKVYRPSADYALDFAAACQSIRSFHQYVKLLNDNLDTFTFKNLIKNIPVHLDFNDYLYYKFAQKMKLVLVTGDSDYAVEDVLIITSHPTLLRLK